MSEILSKQQSRDPTKRFPRYPTADDVGKLAKDIWKRPKFRLEQTADTTKFTFSLGFNISERARKEMEAFYALLFDPKRTELKRAVKLAYRRACYGSDKVRDLCDRVLFKVLAESLAILFEEANQTEGPYKDRLEGDAKALLDAAKRKRRPHDPKRRLTAKRMAKRYDELLPQIKGFRKSIASRGNRSHETILRQAVEEHSPHEWTRHVTGGSALRKLPEIPGHYEQKNTLGGLDWTPRQLAVGIIWCEEKERDPAFDVSPQTILDDYLTLGRKLNAKPK